MTAAGPGRQRAARLDKAMDAHAFFCRNREEIKGVWGKKTFPPKTNHEAERSDIRTGKAGET